MPKREMIFGGLLVDYPGCWLLKLTVEGEVGQYAVVRKPDGTYWEVEEEHVFPPEGGTLKIVTGNQVVDASRVAMLNEWYSRIREQISKETKTTAQ